MVERKLSDFFFKLELIDARNALAFLNVGTLASPSSVRLTEIADHVGKVATPQGGDALLVADACEAVADAGVPGDLALPKHVLCVNLMTAENHLIMQR